MSNPAPPEPEGWAALREADNTPRAAEPAEPRPEPTEDGRSLYTVVGPHAIEGVETGGTVELAVSHGEQLIEAGHVVAALADSEDEPESNEPEDIGPEPEPTDTEGV